MGKPNPGSETISPSPSPNPCVPGSQWETPGTAEGSSPRPPSVVRHSVKPSLEPNSRDTKMVRSDLGLPTSNPGIPGKKNKKHHNKYRGRNFTAHLAGASPGQTNSTGTFWDGIRISSPYPGVPTKMSPEAPPKKLHEPSTQFYNLNGYRLGYADVRRAASQSTIGFAHIGRELSGVLVNLDHDWLNDLIMKTHCGQQLDKAAGRDAREGCWTVFRTDLYRGRSIFKDFVVNHCTDSWQPGLVCLIMIWIEDQFWPEATATTTEQ